MSHGIGRSGDIAELQPKAVGSTLMQRLTRYLALDALRTAGVFNVSSCLVVPLATGMALALTMQALRKDRPGAQYVVWPRADQKSCLKAIAFAGFTPVVVENRLEGDEVVTDMEAVRRALDAHPPGDVLCVISTTACFAPRAPDAVVDIALECKARGIPHVVNNAYGVQCSPCTHLVAEAGRVGRLDAFVQSTDKNFMVPVGGAVIASPVKGFTEEVGKCYPGRASAGPVLDLFVTLLSLGKGGYKQLLDSRKGVFAHLQAAMRRVADELGERVLETRHNTISIGMTLSGLADPKRLGGMLFRRCCSGHRVVTSPSPKQTIAGCEFLNYGAHVDVYTPGAYLTVSAALGIREGDVDVFCERLAMAYRELKRT